MTEYNAKSQNSRVFEISKGDDLVGKLIYQSWFKFNATMEIQQLPKYQVAEKGFWGTTIEVKDGDSVLLKFSMNWSGEIVLQSFFNSIETGYVFKHRGFFKESFVLLDMEKAELIIMKPILKWNSMNYQYSITTSDAFERFSNKEVLLMTSLHCANFYMSMMMVGT